MTTPSTSFIFISFSQALTPDDPDIQGTLGLTQVAEKLSPVQGFGIEFILGFVLVLVVFGVCDSNRNSIHIPAPLAIGLTVAVGHLAAVRKPLKKFALVLMFMQQTLLTRMNCLNSDSKEIMIFLQVPLTGASMNPARTFGSAVIAGIWENHWVYWLGPILGGVAAALIYHHAFTAPSTDEVTEYSPVNAEEKEVILVRLPKNFLATNLPPIFSLIRIFLFFSA